MDEAHLATGHPDELIGEIFHSQFARVAEVDRHALRQVALGGVGFSETVLVTPEGNEVLTNSPRHFS